MDGAKKLKEFVSGVIAAIIDKNGDYTCAAMLVASWIRYSTGKDESGKEIDINDPSKDIFVPLA